MITRETIEARHDEVTTLVKWWVLQEKYRYHKIRRRGWSLDDFVNDVWVRLLEQFRDAFSLDCLLSTVVVNMCWWQLAKHYRNQTTFEFRMLINCEELTDSHVYTDTLARDRDDAKAFDVALASAISQLTRRECMVLRARYGLFGDDCRTLEETAKPLKLSRERVRQIESNALKKLQHYTLADTLKPFYPLVPNPEEFYQ